MPGRDYQRICHECFERAQAAAWRSEFGGYKVPGKGASE